MKDKQNKKQKMDKNQLFVRIMALILAGITVLSVFGTLIFALIH